MDQETLEALLAEWQKTLGLADWDVVVKMRRVFDMNRSDIAGECRWTLSNRTALIGLLDPADYDSAYVRPLDLEKTLVHELLHLHFAPFCEIGSETYQHEQAIEAIAKALVTVKRGAPILPEGFEVGGLYTVQLPRGRKRPTYKVGGRGPRRPSEVVKREIGGVVEVCSPISFEHAEAEARRHWDERKAERKASRS